MASRKFLDNVLYVWRPERALDFASTEVMFGSQKIKKQKLVGIPSDITNINFRRKENRYTFDGVVAMQNVNVGIDQPKEIKKELPF